MRLLHVVLHLQHHHVRTKNGTICTFADYNSSRFRVAVACPAAISARRVILSSLPFMTVSYGGT